MTTCIRCHRPLKRPTESGMGEVCRKKSQAQAVPAHERDLFGYDVSLGAQAALARISVLIDSMAAEAEMAVRHGFAAARRRLGVWS